jgi:pyruvate,water dikinase
MSAIELLDSLDGILAGAVDAFRYTMVMGFAYMGPTFELVKFCEEEMGSDGPQLMATLLQGFDNATAAAGAGLSGLADVAAGLPEVAKALREGRYEGLDSLQGGTEFVAHLGAYLDEYGWRAESWGLPHLPTWSEDPRTPLTLIGRYLSDANSTPAAAIERSRQQREAATQEAESRLSGAKLAEFKSRLAACESHVPISEGGAHWQLTIIGSLRVPFLALGRKLMATGVLNEPNDVFFLSVEELKGASRHPDRALHALVRSRTADLQRQERMTPPPFVGTPPEGEPPPEMQTLLTKFFGLGVIPSTDEKVINGNGASRGVVRGRARIIRELSETDRLQPGEILVCPATAPPWTPLFAIAAAIVTDTGGILSHSAICAREYGIPCVVGTQVGTRQIPDGAMITVDGAEGTVRIEN